MPSETIYRQATLEDLKVFYKDAGAYYSSRAIAVLKNGEVVGVGGVCRVNNQMVVFTDIKSDKVTKKEIVTAARMVLEIIKRYTMVVAFSDGSQPTTLSFATHFGFEQTNRETESGALFVRVNK